MSKKIISFLVNVHRLPDDLNAVVHNADDPLYNTAQIYLKLINTDLLWKIWHIDEYGGHWIEVNFINNDGETEYHTIKIDSGTYDEIDYDEYEVLTDLSAS